MVGYGQLVGNCNAPYDTPEGLVEILVGEGVEWCFRKGTKGA